MILAGPIEQLREGLALDLISMVISFNAIYEDDSMVRSLTGQGLIAIIQQFEHATDQARAPRQHLLTEALTVMQTNPEALTAAQAALIQNTIMRQFQRIAAKEFPAHQHH
jgi:hypothetical protein